MVNPKTDPARVSVFAKEPATKQCVKQDTLARDLTVMVASRMVLPDVSECISDVRNCEAVGKDVRTMHHQATSMWHIILCS